MNEAFSTNPLERGLKQEVSEDRATSLAKARVEYDRRSKEIHRLIDGISKGLTRHHAEAGEKLHWGHVGDLGHYHQQLRDLHDSLWRRGEYAVNPVAGA